MNASSRRAREEMTERCSRRWHTSHSGRASPYGGLDLEIDGDEETWQVSGAEGCDCQRQKPRLVLLLLQPTAIPRTSGRCAGGGAPAVVLAGVSTSCGVR